MLQKKFLHSGYCKSLNPKSDSMRGSYTTQQKLKINILLERMNTALLNDANFCEKKPYKLKNIYFIITQFQKKHGITFDEAINTVYDKIKKNNYLLIKDDLYKS